MGFLPCFLVLRICRRVRTCFVFRQHSPLDCLCVLFYLLFLCYEMMFFFSVKNQVDLENESTVSVFIIGFVTNVLRSVVSLNHATMVTFGFL